MAEALIATEDLVKDYHLGTRRIHALRKVSVSIEPGEFVAVMGPSGSGKSTFMNLLGCLDTPTAGQYRLDGLDVSRMGRDRLYSATLGRDRQARARAKLAAVGLSEREHHHPAQLSGGQQQRVAIARALINDPVLILADEPTGALDSHTSVEIMALFQDLNREGITVVVVTHEADIVRYAGRVLGFRDGRLTRDEQVRDRLVAREQLASLPRGDEQEEEDLEAEVSSP